MHISSIYKKTQFLWVKYRSIPKYDDFAWNGRAQSHLNVQNVVNDVLFSFKTIQSPPIFFLLELCLLLLHLYDEPILYIYIHSSQCPLQKDPCNLGEKS